ncbi:MAG TPA: hypothetical protein VJ829_10505, partial [Candidatus Binatia bacterium]|nr:hypothetical protein [Candidatus Binatia bacterium]
SPIVIGTPPCTPTNVAHLELSGGVVTDQATEDAILDAFRSTLTHLGGAAVTRDGGALDVTPPANVPRICGGFALPVASGDERTIAVSVHDSLAPPTVDNDRLTFSCTP